MPCDGRNPNCDRRRELLAQLKCLISSMDRKKPCEWDEPPPVPMVCCPTEPPLCTLPYCGFTKPYKGFSIRGSLMLRCECIKRNGMQDRCMMWDCMGRPECMTKLYPVCEPGRAALLNLTDLGDAEMALKKFYCADQAREAALATYCRLTCDKARQKQTFLCNSDNNQNVEAFCAPLMCRNNTLNCNDNSLDCCGIPSAYPDCCTLQSCNICCPPRKLKECSFSCNPPITCLPSMPCCPAM